MKITAAILLFLSTPAWGASFDGVWQGENAAGRYRFAIHGDVVKEYIESKGEFAKDGECSFGIDREGKGAFLAYQECASDGGSFATGDGYRLWVKNKNTLRVRFESGTDQHYVHDWVRVR